MTWQVLKALKNKFEKLASYFLVFFVLSLVISLARNIVRIDKAKMRISEAQENVFKLEEKNIELEAKLELVKKEEFVEKQMRDKLGLAKEGEIVVILPDDEVLRKFAPNYENETETLPEPNWKKWFNLFL